MGLDMFLSDKNGLDVAYWRKANQIHGWFVTNVQNGIDDCKEYEVPRDKIKELLQLCKTVLETKDSSKLPPTRGFFFGTSQVDSYYWNDVQETIYLLEEALVSDSQTFYYSSSW